MYQNIKIFFNNRFILLTNKSSQNDVKYTSKKELKKWINEFQTLGTELYIPQLVIYSPDLATLYKDFSENFKLIYAAGGIVKNSKNQILFIKRLGKWDLPKGKMENGEIPAETALREVEEECGISQLKIINELESTFHTYNLNNECVLKQNFWFNIYYSGNEKLIPQTEENIIEVKWIDSSEIENVLTNTYDSLKDLLKKITF